jgi:predicted metal-dependent hydrolase
MSTERAEIRVSGVAVQVVRKDIKNLHLGVYPPHGRVRVAAPLRVSDNAVRLAVVGKLAWVKRQKAKFEAQPRQSEREMVSGESHYFRGKRYRLRVIERKGANRVFLRNSSIMDLYLQPGTSAANRQRVLQSWYREQLRALIPPLLERWQPLVGVHVTHWVIKRMKTKWGTCTLKARRIWLNLELAKKPVSCLEFILVHELVHLLERHHTDRFRDYMNRLMPQWRLRREELNRAPLSHESWSY